jgi:hypothetical protein
MLYRRRQSDLLNDPDLAVAHAPVRLSCGCMTSPLRHAFTCD